MSEHRNTIILIKEGEYNMIVPRMYTWGDVVTNYKEKVIEWYHTKEFSKKIPWFAFQKLSVSETMLTLIDFLLWVLKDSEKAIHVGLREHTDGSVSLIKVDEFTRVKSIELDEEDS